MNMFRNFIRKLVFGSGLFLASCASQKYINSLEKIIKQEYTIVSVNENYRWQYEDYYAPVQKNIVEKQKIEIDKNAIAYLKKGR